LAYRLHRDERGVPSIALLDEPAWCHALAANAHAREAALSRGTWLVLAFPVWSVPDVEAVQIALDVAHQSGGRLDLGLRPYDDPIELRASWPDVDVDASGPYWVLLQDGTVRRHRAGRMGVDELERWLSDARPA
jgi:hypothetical protein